MAICLAGSTSAFYGVFELPLPRMRTGVLGSFVLGVLFAVLGGWFLGKALWRSIRTGGIHMVTIVIVALVTGVSVFLFLANHFGYLSLHHSLCEALVTALVGMALIGNSRALGHVLVSRSVHVPPRRRLMALGLLYGPILGGAVLARLVPFTWGPVPPVPVYQREKRPIADLLAEARGEFPPKEASLEVSDRRIEIKYRCGGYDLDNAVLYQDIVEADGPEVDLPDGKIELLGISLYTKERSLLDDEAESELERRFAEGHTMALRERDDGRLSQLARMGHWKPDGTPVPSEEWPHFSSWGGGGVLEAIVLMRAKGDIRLDEGLVHDLLWMPREVPVAFEWFRPTARIWSAVGERLIPLRYIVQLPVPGPLELRLMVVHPEEIEHVLPNLVGESIDLETNTVRLETVLAGKWHDITANKFGNLITADAGKPKSEPGESRTTVVFSTALAFLGPKYGEVSQGGMSRLADRVHPGRSLLIPRVEALLADGRSVAPIPKVAGYQSNYAVYEFGCDSEEIIGFRVVEHPRVTQVRIPIPDFPFFPEANRDLDDLLALRLPYPVRDPSDAGDVLAGHPAAMFVRNVPRFRTDSTAVFPAGCSLRQLLDAYCPGRWRVESGRIVLFEPRNIRTRIVEAIHADPSVRASFIISGEPYPYCLE